MTPSNFTPKVFIGIGETGAYYTLRETYLHWDSYSKTYVVWSSHICNLSQDAEEAIVKANDYAATVALPMTSKLEDIQQEMREIKRAGSKELAARAERIRIREEEAAEERRKDFEAKMQMIAEGKHPMGPFWNKAFADAPRGYNTWLVRNRDKFEDGSIPFFTSLAVEEHAAETLLPEPDKELHVGEVKKRYTYEVTVIRKFTGYGENTWGSYAYHIVTMVDKKTNACLVSIGAFNAEEGEELTIKGTVKRHDTYKGQAQTIIQRVAKQ